MSLIWQLSYRARPGMEEKLQAWQEQRAEIVERLDVGFRVFLRGDYWRRPEQDRGSMLEEFEAQQSTRGLRRRLERLDERINSARIHPLETVNAPRVGIDEIATEHIRKQYGERLKRLSSDEGRGESFDDYLERYHGCYVPRLAERGREIMRVSAYEDGVVFFYGQVVEDADFVTEDVRREAGEEKTAAGLLLLGERIFECIERVGRSPEEPRTTERDVHIEAVRAAALWCTFWGNEGHGMTPLFRSGAHGLTV